MKFSEKLYQEALEQLSAGFPSVQTSGFNQASFKPGLSSMKAFDEVLGSPHSAYRTIHVAGTNGKGSVANMLASALSAAGFRTGLYTSPHILDFRERMRIADAGGTSLVQKEFVLEFITQHMDDFRNFGLSYFEITTSMAFAWFAKEKVDVAVVEVGLGGRLDSTNIIDSDLAVVTSIGLDHCAILGSTRGRIAAEKAGIAKKGGTLLVWGHDETAPVFDEAANKVGARLVFADDAEPSLWPESGLLLAQMDLAGSCQEQNLRTVMSALDILSAMPGYAALSDKQMILPAIAHTAGRMDFHGRWERLSHHPQVICDIGHNPPALKGNFAQLESMLADGSCSSLTLVYGIMADKDLDGIMPLMPENAAYVFTAPGGERRLPVSALYERYLEFCLSHGRDVSRVFAAETVREAVGLAVKLSSADANPLIYIGGSTFVVAEALPLFQKK